ncbi:fungal Zn binuclear cluster domain-containing protein [Purpureocillium lavendulum]|uniref:Fungal Zn binuclear cluster domain-containing protein n=1 Tax=Purpureocillium lavendulum TaxID=1247861 RepID=A0AB34FJN0_9HYPO|nr:fungal Zn binuclear cluster domain-containing protein [Purpureocillium lavendulum]
MLLYTRVAPPKVPKRRSRAGCNFCKEKVTLHFTPALPCRDDGQDQQDSRSATEEEMRRGPSPVLAADQAEGPGQHPDLDDGGHAGDQTDSADAAEGAPSVAAALGSAGTPRASCHQRRRSAHRRPLSVTTTATYEYLQDREGSSSSDASPQTASDDWPIHPALLHDGGQYEAAPAITSAPVTTPYTPCIDFSAFSFDNVDFSALAADSAGADQDDVSQAAADALGSFSPNSDAPSSCADRSLALVAPSPRLEFTAPAFYEFSRDAGRRNLIAHFCNTLSHLIVLREDDGNNPFQQLVLPLSHGSPAVMGAIYALASAHLEVRGVDPGGAHASVRYHSQAIHGLARLIEQGDGVDKNELLAAIMLLVYYEVLVQRGRSNLVDGHLKGAMAIMGNAPPQNNPTGVFLERAFRFYDVIAALSFGTAPLSSCPSSGGFTPFAPLDSRGAAVTYDSVDALLGMATSLWPIIHRLSNLLALKNELAVAVATGELSKAAVLRTEFDSTCAAIEIALQDWEPILPHDFQRHGMRDGDSAKDEEHRRLQSILNSALAYRHSAFVYLYRSIYDCPRSHPVVQLHTHVSLKHCEATVAHGGPMGSLLWPLFVSACEAMEPADRALARRSFAGISRRQGMKNIERSWCVVEEVWQRADAQEASFVDDDDDDVGFLKMPSMKRRGDLWRKVSADMGWTIVFG